MHIGSAPEGTDAAARPGLLCMGTAQLGMSYGVANRTGQPSLTEAGRMIDTCLKEGINNFDTAGGYGESEKILGGIFLSLGVTDLVSVITKGMIGRGGESLLRKSVEASLSRLCVTKLSGWMLHNAGDLEHWTAECAREADSMLKEGKISAVGLSCYQPAEAVCGLEEHGMKLLQFPASVFDRRFLHPRVLQRLVACRASIYVRSIYLQGLCLMPTSAVPAHIPHAVRAVSVLDGFCRSHMLDRDAFCFQYIVWRLRTTGARLVIGLETHSQLERTLTLAKDATLPAELFAAWDELWPVDLEDLILPTRWPKSRA